MERVKDNDRKSDIIENNGNDNEFLIAENANNKQIEQNNEICFNCTNNNKDILQMYIKD